MKKTSAKNISAKNYLDRVRFLSVPETLRGTIEKDASFAIDPAVPIPVEIPPGQETINMEELSGEMITAGMLRVIQAGDCPEGYGSGETQADPQRLDYYRRFVLALRPGIFGEFTEAAIIKARSGDFDLALDILGILQALIPRSPSTLLNRALVLEQRAMLFQRQGRAEAPPEFREAEAAYEQALALEPPFPDAFFNAGFFYYGQKNYRRAGECFSRYLEIADDGEKKEKARAITGEIGESGLDDEVFAEACAQIRQGRLGEGLEGARDFIERHPSVWNGWFILGWALRRLERWEDGAAAFRKAIELGAQESDTRNELAICLMETGDYQAARRELETALRHDSENIKIISNLGVLAMKNGDDDEAAAFFRTVLELDSADPVAKKYLEDRALD